MRRSWSLSSHERQLDTGPELAGDVSLNAPIGDERDPADWQDWLVDEASDQETRLADDEEAGNRRQALVKSLAVIVRAQARRYLRMTSALGSRPSPGLCGTAIAPFFGTIASP